MEEKYKILVEKLNNNTLEKKITWETTSLEGQYKVKLGLGSIVLSKVVKNVRQHQAVFSRLFYEFQVVNAEGGISDSISIYKSANNEDDFLLLKQLYDNVENVYLKKDETLNSMLDALDNL